MESGLTHMESMLSIDNLERQGPDVKDPFHILRARLRVGRRFEQRDAPDEALGLKMLHDGPSGINVQGLSRLVVKAFGRRFELDQVQGVAPDEALGVKMLNDSPSIINVRFAGERCC